MSEAIKNEGQATGTTQPEANGAPAGKTFTQEEVNKIVSDRLAKERAKQEPQSDPAAEQLAQREKELAARESRMTCTEYIKEKRLKPELLDIFDSSNAEQFKETVEKLLEVYPILSMSALQFTLKTGMSHQGGSPVGGRDRRISDAFKP